jgi:hypothetical protein
LRINELHQKLWYYPTFSKNILIVYQTHSLLSHQSRYDSPSGNKKIENGHPATTAAELQAVFCFQSSACWHPAFCRSLIAQSS